MTDLVIGLTIIAAALAVAIRSHLDKRKRQQEQRDKVMRRLLDATPIDMFPRERYTLSPLDIAIVRDLVDKR